MSIRKIYRRVYDNHLNADGSEKENSVIGVYEVIQQLSGSEHDYSEQFIGCEIDTDKIYLIEGVEVSGFNGGTRYSCVELKGLQKVYKRFSHD